MVVAWPTTTVLSDRLTAVEVARVFTVSPLVSLRAVCTGVAAKLAVMLWMLAAAALKDTEQVAASVPLAPRLQVPVMVSLPTDEVTATVPVGLDLVPATSTSVTFTLMVVVWATTTGLSANVTAVVVVRVFTVSVWLLLLVLCTLVTAKVRPRA